LRCAEVGYLRRAPGRGLLVFIGDDRFEMFDSEFLETDAVDAVFDAMRAAVLRTPDGAARLVDMQGRQRVADIIVRRATIATTGLLVLVTAVFVIEMALRASNNPALLIRLGGNAPALVWQGEYWRLLSAGLLHANLVHYVLNLSALMSFATLLEQLLGRARFIVIAVTTIAAGNWASATWGGHPVSIGASSAVFGIMGALMVAQARARSKLPPSLVMSTRSWLTMLGINGLISLLPGVDLLAHAGGFAAGLALCPLLMYRLDVTRPGEGLFVRVAAGCALLLLGGALLLAARHALTPLPAHPQQRGGLQLKLMQLPGFRIALPPGPAAIGVKDPRRGALRLEPVPGIHDGVTLRWGEGAVTRRLLKRFTGPLLQRFAAGATPRYRTLTLADGAHVELFELKPDSRYYFDVALFGCGKR
jgi:rhomboid protease GluP